MYIIHDQVSQNLVKISGYRTNAFLKSTVPSRAFPLQEQSYSRTAVLKTYFILRAY